MASSPEIPVWCCTSGTASGKDTVAGHNPSTANNIRSILNEFFVGINISKGNRVYGCFFDSVTSYTDDVTEHAVSYTNSISIGSYHFFQSIVNLAEPFCAPTLSLLKPSC